MTVWSAYQKKETSQKLHANLYDNNHMQYVMNLMWMYIHCLFVFQTGSRYDAQVAVFGSDFQKKLSEQKYFIVSGYKVSLQIKRKKT